MLALVVAADKYLCVDSIRPTLMANIMSFTHREKPMYPKLLNNSLREPLLDTWRLASAAYMLRLPEAFAIFTRRLLLEHSETFLDLPVIPGEGAVPSSILSKSLNKDDVVPQRWNEELMTYLALLEQRRQNIRHDSMEHGTAHSLWKHLRSILPPWWRSLSMRGLMFNLDYGGLAYIVLKALRNMAEREYRQAVGLCLMCTTDEITQEGEQRCDHREWLKTAAESDPLEPFDRLHEEIKERERQHADLARQSAHNQGLTNCRLSQDYSELVPDRAVSKEEECVVFGDWINDYEA
ncbi:hypothetical protein LTR27_010047 [Elasticomyces elasticus]|nr:hypothetical protein LTR27_010047 [Elasticomyces elasticus]